MTRRPKFPAPLYDIPHEEIEEVARDVRWESEGCKIFFAVDAKDVIDYCYPLNPFDIAEQKLDEIAVHQTALDLVFCRRRPQPLILPHYVGELVNHFKRIQNSASRAYEDLEMWHRIRWGLAIGSRKGASANETTEEEFSSLKQNIVRYLAVWLGIDSLGSERLRKIMNGDLKSVKEMCEEVHDPELDAIIADYKPQWTKQIADYLKSQIPSSTPEHKLPARKEASRRDAMSVDWLLYLNAKCSELRIKNRDDSAGEAIPRYLFLYMSSAPKTEHLFHDFLLKQDWYPLRFAEGKDKQEVPFNCHRNRRQILLVAQAGWGGDVDSSRTSANLDEINHISDMIVQMEKGVKEACDRCVLDKFDGAADCAWREICKAVQKVQGKTADVPDLGLMSKLKQYQDILRARPRLKDQKLCLQELDEILRTEIPDIALRRVRDQQFFAMTQTLLARWLSESSEPDSSPALPEPLLSLTVIFPRLPAPYDRTQDSIARYCSLDWTKMDERRDVLVRAMHEFLALDEKKESPAGKEHELARLLLHLAFGGSYGYFDVIERSRQLRESVEEIRDDPYVFLLCSLIASLQLVRYVDTLRYIAEAMKLRPDEPFLYHARGVNTFAWRRNPELRAFCSRDIKTSIDDEERALALLRDQTRQDEAIKQFEGLLLNNLTYIQSYSREGEFAQIFNLEQAQKFFQELVEVVPRDRWRPIYFHTDAYLHYQLASLEPDARVDHLNQALAAIAQAILRRPHNEEYLKLQKQIETALLCRSSDPLPVL